MPRTLCVKPKEVGVVCYQYTPRGGGKRKLRGIVSAGQFRVHRCRHVDVPAA